MIVEQKLRTMLQLQDEMNTKVHSDWRGQGFEWYRAIWVECAELMDHYGWKWWKKQDPDRDQVVLELIDIWHFGLSRMLELGGSSGKIAKNIADELDLTTQGGDFKEDVEAFSETVLRTRSFDVKGFSKLMMGMDLTFDQLYTSYVGKNVLNFFRQDNGYKDGSYKKVWNQKEDNEHLVEILESLNSNNPDFKAKVYDGLAARYLAQSLP